MKMKMFRDKDGDLHITDFTDDQEPPRYLFLQYLNKKIIVRYEYDTEMYVVKGKKEENDDKNT